MVRIHATKVEVTAGKAPTYGYYVEFANPERFGSRPIFFVTQRTVKEVEDFIKKGVYAYDVGELGIVSEPGELWWEELPEDLKHDAEVYWGLGDVVWTPEAEADREIYRKKYGRREVEGLRVADLKRICRVKGLSTVGRRGELINRVLGEEFKPKMKDLMAGRVLDGYVEARRVRDLTEFIPETALEKRRKELLRQAEDLKKRLRKSQEESKVKYLATCADCREWREAVAEVDDYPLCKECVEKLASGVYPGGSVFPTMWKERGKWLK